MKRFYTFFVLIFATVLLTYTPPVSAKVTGPQIYWLSDRGEIHYTSPDGSSVETLHIGTDFWNISIDMAAGKIYLIDWGTIHRSSLDGSNFEMLVNIGDFIWSIALDTAAGKMYLGQGHGKIMRADLDGTNIETIITNPDYAAETNDNANYGVAGIALDVEGGKIYWAEHGLEDGDGKIKCANLNGSDIKTLVSGLLSPLDITLDVEDDKMYWIDWIDGFDFGIKRANLDGTDVGLLHVQEDFIEGIALDTIGGKMYWIEPYGIKRINLDGTNIETLVSGERIENLDKTLAFRVVRPRDIALNLSTADVSNTASLDRITISEIMVATKGGNLPQWIELYNPSDTHAVSLNGWKVEIVSPRSTASLTFPEKSIKPQETLLIVSKQGRASDNFQNEQIYNLSNSPVFQNHVLLREEFYMKLSDAAGKLVDEVGNFNTDDDKSTWSLPKSLTEEGARASMIRRHDDGVPRLGTDESGWISAINTKLLTGTTSYYGHPDDIGAPGVKSGGALPVSLSGFRAELTDAGIIIKWATESELDNAGFNILRSETKDGEFKIVNPKLIQGAGTTTERHIYTWTDTTAKPNVVYYYQIEDISHAGVREQLATVRMRGYVSAVGKLTTKWGDLKLQK